MSRVLRPLAMVALLLLSGTAAAHEISLAELELRQTSHGQFQLQWGAGEKRPPADVLTPVWPDGCIADANTLHCDEEGLNGTLEIKGVGKTYSAVLLKIYWANGQNRVYTLTSAQPRLRLYGSADDGRGMGEIAKVYTVLGVEHILSGYDHLMFVVSLLFLVGFNRRLLWTITAFTLAHSLTLALSALDWLTLRPPPVEASIALSIMLVAGEALHHRQTFARRWPPAVAFLFGLVHGLGFAGALKEIGLPQNHLPVALLTFNLGVEMGQLLVVGIAYLVYRLVARQPPFALARTPALYAIGSVAAFWSIGRIVSILG